MQQRILKMATEPSQLASEYERNVGKLIEEKNLKLEQLKNSQEISPTDIQKLQEEIESLQSLFDNYNLGMNYFRRARGGRSGLRE
jgi:hypothetical protein